MNTHRRILTPAVASVLAGLVVTLGTVGGSMTGDRAAEAKTDRFAGIGDTLCASQEWPNISNECLAWSEGEIIDGAVRYVTLASTDQEAGVTTLARVPASDEAY